MWENAGDILPVASTVMGSEMLCYHTLTTARVVSHWLSYHAAIPVGKLQPVNSLAMASVGGHLASSDLVRHPNQISLQHFNLSTTTIEKWAKLGVRIRSFWYRSYYTYQIAFGELRRPYPSLLSIHVSIPSILKIYFGIGRTRLRSNCFLAHASNWSAQLTWGFYSVCHSRPENCKGNSKSPCWLLPSQTWSWPSMQITE